MDRAETIATYLKTPLDKGHIHMIIATTDEEYHYLQKDSAYNSRFESITMKNPSREECGQILEQYLKCSYPKISFAEDAREEILNCSCQKRMKIGWPRRIKMLIKRVICSRKTEDAISKEQVLAVYSRLVEEEKSREEKKLLLNTPYSRIL